MKLTILRWHRSKKAMALLIVMGLGGVAIAIVGGVLGWTNTNANLIDRNIAYQNAVLAAEAATEKALSKMATDFAKEGAPTVGKNISLYKRHIPVPNEHPRWGWYKFNNGRGLDDEISVEIIQPWAANTPLLSQYRGLKGYAATFRIRANATDLAENAEAAVYQDVQLAFVPVFQFAVFYNLDLEICPGATMNIRGRVHSNRNIYTAPESSITLTFWDWVTAVGEIFRQRKYPYTNIGNVVYNGGREIGVSTLNLPIGTNNSPAAVRQIVEIPPITESPNDPMYSQRFYNNCDVVILVAETDVSVRGGGISQGVGPVVNWNVASNWISTNKTFTDLRENKTVVVTEIDIGKFAEWATNSSNPIRQAIRNTQNREINSIYVADLRARTSTRMPAVRLVNGAVLPPSGLTVATPNPLYVWGHYNASGSSLGSTNTANTRPAALIADAITILSENWKDTNSSEGIASRKATDTTVNAAFMAGIVETVGNNYSGGLENFPRFLEDWTGRTNTYNGSMVVMFPSQIATNRWQGTGSVYNPPRRNWSFDVNFYNPDKLPPLCPSVRAVIRYKWATIAPRAV